MKKCQKRRGHANLENKLRQKAHFSIQLLLLFLFTWWSPASAAGVSTPVTLQSNQYFNVQTVTAPSQGPALIRTIINSPPHPPPGFSQQRAVVSLPEPDIASGTNILSNVPAFSWSFGCSATSAAMIAGYYDRTGYSNMYNGPTNGGVMPLDNSAWPSWTDSTGASRAQCPLSATHIGLDGRTTRGHVDNYWVGYGVAGTDPWVTNGWPEPTKGECTGDYMNTNQWVYPDDLNGWNSDGSTVFYTYGDSTKLNCSSYTSYPFNTRGDVGIKNFYESRGYTVQECYTQRTDNSAPGGFSFTDFKAEIDAGRPVMIQVQGHTMVGMGYDDSGNTIYIHDTWDYSTHSMPWGGSYVGMAQYAVTVVKLAPVSYTLNVNSTGIAGVAITGNSTYSGTTDYSKTGINAGTSISLTAPYLSGNATFNNWDGCDSSVDMTCTVSMTTDKTVTANYTFPTSPLRLQNNIAVTNLSGNLHDILEYYITVPSGTGSLQIQTWGGTGEADLYVHHGTPPTTSAYDYRSVLAGNTEQIMINNPQAGNWYISVHGKDAFAGVTLKAKFGLHWSLFIQAITKKP